MQHFNLDVADINGNGRPEIFVTGMLNGTVVSYVIEFKDGVYQRIADVPGFLRVVASSRKENILIGQGYDPVSFYCRAAEALCLGSTENMSPHRNSRLPNGVDLYGFAYAEMGEAGPLLVALDGNDQLMVYSNEALIWKSEEKYPSVGDDRGKALDRDRCDAYRRRRRLTNRRKVRISGRVFAVDLNGDGRDEILLPKNIGATFLSGPKEAEFIGLGWTGARLDQRWNIKDIPGAVLDYQVIRLQGLGARILALVMTPGGLFAADRYRLITYATK